MMYIWLLKNFEEPYPDMDTQKKMAEMGSISMKKVHYWFNNARLRYVKPYLNGDII